MLKGRKKKQATELKVDSNSTNSNTIDLLYQQFDSVARKTKISKKALASRIFMSYPGFLNAFKNKRLSLEKWVEISRFLNLPLTIQFELGKKAKTEPETTPHLVEDKEQKTSEYLPINEKVAALQKYIALLEDRLKDKEQIVSLLSSGK